MKEIIVQEAEAGQRLDRLLSRYLKEASRGFLYKMLRKKNITLNGKKAQGREIVRAKDRIRLFLSDETYERFAGKPEQKAVSYPVTKLDIVYEDAHVLMVNKPVGMLTQKAKPEDVSLNEYVLGYLRQSGQWKEGSGSKEEPSEQLCFDFRPSVCNRLDRNTSGIVICGKSLAGLREMSKIIRDRSLHKYYQCLAAGQITDQQKIKGYLWKDPATNKVRIVPKEQEGAWLIETAYHPLRVFSDCTLLEVLLITGRSHQIRAHLASEGHPVIGDWKYGCRELNEAYKKQYGLQSQLLHAGRIELPQMKAPLEALSGKCMEAGMPALMQKILEEKEKEEH